ncbi:hypothetical protein AMTR_s00068p00207720, partial [Amborella trichopoda]
AYLNMTEAIQSRPNLTEAATLSVDSLQLMSKIRRVESLRPKLSKFDNNDTR